MATSFKEFTYTFGANEKILINSVGSVIRCTRGTNNFEIQPQAINESFSKIPFENGLSVTYEYDFDKIASILSGFRSNAQNRNVSGCH